MTHVNADLIHELHNNSGTVSRIKAGYAVQDRREAAYNAHKELLSHPQFGSLSEVDGGTLLLFTPGALPHGVLMHRRRGEQSDEFYRRAFFYCKKKAKLCCEPSMAETALLRAQYEEMQ